MQASLSGLVPFLIALFVFILPAAAQDNNLDTLPRETYVPFIRQGNLILVTGSINGKTTPMIFDTGAGGCLFSTQTMKSLGIKMPANLKSAIVAGVGSKQQTKAWIMPVDLKLGSIERRSFPVHINDNPLNLPLLGVDFFHGFEYTINTQSNIIQFKLVSRERAASANQNPPQSAPKFTIIKIDAKILRTLKSDKVTTIDNKVDVESKTNGLNSEELVAHLTSKPVITVDNQCHYIYTVPFAEYGGAIVVMVEIGGKKCPMILDTGTNLCVFTTAHLKELGIAPHFTGRMLNAKGATGFIKAPLCMFDHAQFGPIKDQLVCLVTDEGFMPRPLLGENFFSKWELTVDHVNKVIKFQHK